jgi:hypothetical protein
VSGYLERLVGRHVEPPSVRPRPVSRFEGDLVGGAVPPEVAGSRGPSPRAAPAEPTPAPQEQVGVASATRLAPPAAQPSIARAAPSRASASLPERTAEPAIPPPAPLAGQAPRPVGPMERSHQDEPATKPGPDRPITAAAIHRAEVPQPAAPPRAQLAPSRRSAEPSPREPDVVHVHIGRVEVRATVPAPQPSRPPPRPTRPAPMSLERYLAGERRT